MRQKLILWLTTLLVLGTTSAMIVHKENVIKEGTLMLLELAPVDPRSIMQGDYMVLSYRLANLLRNELNKNDKYKKQQAINGQIVVSLTPAAETKFIRIYDASKPLAKNEYLLKFRKRGRNIRFAAEAWFFQEGHASDFSKARYSEIRVSDKGEAVLTGLRDKQLKPLRYTVKKTSAGQ